MSGAIDVVRPFRAALVLILLCTAGCSQHEDGGLPTASGPARTATAATPSPEAVARQQITAAFARLVNESNRGHTEAPAGWDPADVATGAVRRNLRTSVANQRTVGNVVTGTSTASHLTVDRIDLAEDTPTARVRACIDDRFTERNTQSRKIVAKPGGKLSWMFVYQRIRGHWLAARGTVQSVGATGSCASH